MASFQSFRGIVMSIENFWTNAQEPAGCFKLMSVIGDNRDSVHFVVSPNTYFVHHAVIRRRDIIVGFYDSDMPTPMIYPPQYRALVIAKIMPNQCVTVDHFDSQLISSNGSLQLRVMPSTRFFLTNGQPFLGRLQNRDLVVVSRASTQAVSSRMTGTPRQIAPTQVVVLCRDDGSGNCG